MRAPTVNKFRLNGKQFFFTYPQCDTSKEQVMAAIKRIFGGELNWAVVARENHQDGTPHIHAVIVLKSKFSTRDTRFFDCIAGKHGNYQACRSLNKTLEYVMKDGDYAD